MTQYETDASHSLTEMSHNTILDSPANVHKPKQGGGLYSIPPSHVERMDCENLTISHTRERHLQIA